MKYVDESNQIEKNEQCILVNSNTVFEKEMVNNDIVLYNTLENLNNSYANEVLAKGFDKHHNLIKGFHFCSLNGGMEYQLKCLDDFELTISSEDSDSSGDTDSSEDSYSDSEDYELTIKVLRKESLKVLRKKSLKVLRKKSLNNYNAAVILAYLYRYHVELEIEDITHADTLTITQHLLSNNYAYKNHSPYPAMLLGDLYAQGLGVDQDFELAAKYYSLAAETGNGDACYKMMYLHMVGQGVQQSDELAEKYAYQAAKADSYPYALRLWLGFLYHKIFHTPRLAIDFYESIYFKNTDTLVNLAELYVSVGDNQNAAKYYQLAALKDSEYEVLADKYSKFLKDYTVCIELAERYKNRARDEIKYEALAIKYCMFLKDYSIYQVLGEKYFSSNIDLAIEYLFIAVNNGFKESHATLGKAFEEKKDYQKAKMHYALHPTGLKPLNKLNSTLEVELELSVNRATESNNLDEIKECLKKGAPISEKALAKSLENTKIATLLMIHGALATYRCRTTRQNDTVSFDKAWLAVNDYCVLVLLFLFNAEKIFPMSLHTIS